MNNLKKTLALMAALAMTATAFVGCGDDDTSSSTTEATTTAAEETTEGDVAEETTEGDVAEETTEAGEAAEVPALGTPDGTLGEGGDALTILCWTEDDLTHMYDVVANQSGMDKSMMVYKNVGANGTEANEKYTQMFASDEDVDLYFCDADWNMAYQNNDEYSAPLSAVGITEDMYANAYEYTVAMGKDSNGVLKGASWQAAAGGYVYRADLAEQYLGITTPEDMQAKISDWDAFWATAAEVYTASKGVTAMADSLNGVWKAYSNGSRKTAWVQNGKITADTVTSSIGDFISMAKSNYDAGYISTAAQWTDGWLTQGMSTGDYANGTFGFFFPTWTIGANSLLSQAQGAEGAEYGMYNICEGPTSWFWGGSWICVSPKTDNATEAGKFIYAMTVDPVSMRAYADAKGDLVNNKDVMAEIVAEGTNSNPLLGGQDQFAILADSAANIDMSIATQYDSTINTELQIALQAYCKGTITSEEGCVDEFLDMLAEELTDVIVE